MIRIKNFSKSFGQLKVVDNISFEVKKGEIFAFIGPNGAGKTTTIRCLLGIYTPTEGELLIDGEKYNPDMSSMLGYLPEDRGMYMDSKVLETFVYFGKLKGLSQREAKERALNYLDKVELKNKINTKINKLSSGQQQKIQIGITIINEPQLLILDEPTKGLDPVNRNLLMELLLELHKKGSTIIFSSHHLEEVEQIADRLFMIKEGKEKLYGKVNEVRKQFGTNTIKVSFKGKLPQNEKLYTATVEKNYAEITPQEKISTTDILKFLIDKKLEISSFKTSAPSLNEIFIKITKEN